MFTEASDECRQYVVARAPTARVTRSQGITEVIEKK
jgi:hypothetical protein